MSNTENRRIEIGLYVSEDIDSGHKTLSVLYAMPLIAQLQQIEFVQNKYAENLDSDTADHKNLLSYKDLDTTDYLLLSTFQILQSIYTFCLFCLLIRKKIKFSETMHLFVFSSVSFFLQIIPLLVIGKFYRKNVVIEFLDFKNYYFPEESGTISRYFLRFADSVIVQSDRQSRSLQHKKIKAVTLRKKVKFNKSTRVIEEVQPLIMASVHLENVFNLNCLLKAFGLVKQKYPRAELIIIGEGSQKESMEELALSKSYSGVCFKNSDEKNKLFRKADVYVHCYHIEYFTNDIMHAMSHGIPVLSSPIGMVNNIIQRENILMYQYNDFSTLADNLIELVEDNSLVKKLSTNGVQFCKENFTTTSKSDLSAYYKNLS